METHIILMEMPIGNLIKETRLKAGLTQVQLAKASGVSQGLITYYEADAKIPSALKLAALAKALHVSMDDLVDSGHRPDPQSHNGPKLHGNSRGAKVQDLFLQLDEETQRLVLKQIKALAKLGHQASSSDQNHKGRPQAA
jgi:transcriptional regulator with XRE-family HTH domain